MSSTLAPEYKKCASEGGTCSLFDTQSVAYASEKEGTFPYFRVATGSIQCTDARFGDPDTSSDAFKSCYASNIPKDVLVPTSTFYDSGGKPAGWTKCADESGICDPQAGKPVDILYGKDKAYVYARAESTPCNNDIFGDPLPSINKECWWRDPAKAPSPPPPPADPPSTTDLPPANNVGGTTTVTKNKGTNWWLWIGIGAGILLLLVLIGLLIYYFMRKNKAKKAAALTATTMATTSLPTVPVETVKNPVSSLRKYFRR